LSPEQRKYLFVQTAIGAGIVNALINAAFGWAATRGLTEFPAWKTPGVAGDLLVTAFGISFGTCFVAPLQARHDISRGKITPPSALPPLLAAMTGRFPSRLFPRALALGVASMIVFAPPALALLAASGAASLERGSFIAAKAGFAALQGAAVTPLIVLAALLDRLHARPTP
jgi:hypothetical protein